MYKPTFLLLCSLPVALGFTLMPSNGRTTTSARILTTPTKRFPLDDRLHRNQCAVSTRLYESMVEVKMPAEADWVRARGAREWPQQVKSGKWSESIDSGKLATRYVLDGTGSLGVTLYTEEGQSKNEEPVYHRLVKGSLVEAMGPATLEWEVDDQMLILTPGYEQGSLFAIVAALFIVLCGALIGGVGQ